MKKPLIAVTPLYDSEKQSYWMLPGYMKGIEEANGIPVMLPLSADPDILNTLANKFDGFLFTGGHDISPSIYNAEKSSFCGEDCKLRDEMEIYLLKKVLQLEKPILGICRGIQILNAVLGGTLYQDLPTEHPTNVCHKQKPPYDAPVHTVTIDRKSPLFNTLQTQKISVNSYHHQAIKQLSPKLKAMAYSEDALVEAVYLPKTNFVWAVQWHPEFSYATDRNSYLILKEFVKKSTR